MNVNRIVDACFLCLEYLEDSDSGESSKDQLYNY